MVPGKWRVAVSACYGQPLGCGGGIGSDKQEHRDLFPPGPIQMEEWT
jgi:hypothetical protein